MSDIELRWRIIQEDRLRREISREEALRRSNPDQWRRIDAARIARNRDHGALNERLRGVGLKPLDPEPSLDRRLKELQRLEARNRAEIAMRMPQAATFSKKSVGHAVRNRAGGRKRHGRNR